MCPEEKLRLLDKEMQKVKQEILMKNGLVQSDSTKPPVNLSDKVAKSAKPVDKVKKQRKSKDQTPTTNEESKQQAVKK
jgi:hypothetical protein